MTILQDWLDALGQPERYSFSASLTRLCVYPHIPTRDPARTVRVEMWLQANGPGTAQRVCKVFPEGIDGPLPAVVVPFYYPEAMLALDPATGETLASFAEIPMLLELVLTRDGSTLEELAGQAVEIGQMGIVNKKLEPVAAEAELDVFDDDEDGI